MISSNTKTFLLSTLLCLGIVGCAQKEKKIRDESVITYKMEPESTGSIFVDKTKEYGLDGVKGHNLYAVDFNNDTYTDLVVLDEFFSNPKFFQFNKDLKKFESIENPFPEIVRANFLNFIDLNNDGILDVIVGSINQKTEINESSQRVFRGVLNNNKISYVEEAPLPIGTKAVSSILALDYDLDGKLDLFVSNWFYMRANPPRLDFDQLLKGNGFEFKEVSSLLSGEKEQDADDVFVNVTPTFGASICDVDKNGFPDILTNNSNGYYNKLWMNQAAKSFQDLASVSGYASDSDEPAGLKTGGNSFFSLCGDYNLDSIVDIVVGNLIRDIDPPTRDRSAILTGSTLKYPPKFYRSEFYLTEDVRNWAEGNRRGIWIDYNLDGLPDLLVANNGFPPSSRLILFKQHEDHSFEDVAKAEGINLMNPAGIVTIDLNRDGVMDFISAQTNTRAGNVETRLYVYENQTERKNRGSVRFHLQSKKGNYHGISSSLTLKTNKNTYFNENNPNYGSLPSQNEAGVYFSFNTEKVQNVEVRWSVGISDRDGQVKPLIKKYPLTHLNLNQKHTELNLCDDGRVLPRHKKCYK